MSIKDDKQGLLLILAEIVVNASENMCNKEFEKGILDGRWTRDYVLTPVGQQDMYSCVDVAFERLSETFKKFSSLNRDAFELKMQEKYLIQWIAMVLEYLILTIFVWLCVLTKTSIVYLSQA